MSILTSRSQTVNNKERVIYLRRQHPDWFGADIAAELHISRERVRQILVGAKLNTTRKSPYVHTCPTCLKVVDTKRVYCSKACYTKKSYNMYICYDCGAEFKRRVSVVNRKTLKAQTTGKKYRLFCSNVCYRNRFKRLEELCDNYESLN